MSPKYFILRILSIFLFSCRATFPTPSSVVHNHYEFRNEGEYRKSLKIIVNNLKTGDTIEIKKDIYIISRIDG